MVLRWLHTSQASGMCTHIGLMGHVMGIWLSVCTLIVSVDGEKKLNQSTGKIKQTFELPHNFTAVFDC